MGYIVDNILIIVTNALVCPWVAALYYICIVRVGMLVKVKVNLRM